MSAYRARYGGPFLFSCNIRKEDIKFLNIPDQFTNEILELWAKVHFTEKDNQNQNFKMFKRDYSKPNSEALIAELQNVNWSEVLYCESEVTNISTVFQNFHTCILK